MINGEFGPGDDTAHSLYISICMATPPRVIHISLPIDSSENPSDNIISVSRFMEDVSTSSEATYFSPHLDFCPGFQSQAGADPIPGGGGRLPNILVVFPENPMKLRRFNSFDCGKLAMYMLSNGKKILLLFYELFLQLHNNLHLGCNAGGFYEYLMTFYMKETKMCHSTDYS